MGNFSKRPKLKLKLLASKFNRLKIRPTIFRPKLLFTKIYAGWYSVIRKVFEIWKIGCKIGCKYKDTGAYLSEDQKSLLYSVIEISLCRLRTQCNEYNYYRLVLNFQGRIRRDSFDPKIIWKPLVRNDDTSKKQVSLEILTLYDNWNIISRYIALSRDNQIFRTFSDPLELLNFLHHLGFLMWQ